MTYITGISGTQGVETTNADGTTNPNDTQNIVVNTSSATLNINGAGGVDKFNIEASSFTKTLTIAGNLGTVPNYEEAKNNYDSVRIDLSKTSGVDLNISNLLVSNPNDEGIIITASKGQDNITLVAGANHDVIEFTAGGGAGAVAETYTVDLGNLRLGKNQSFTIDGVTITNISEGLVLTANDIAAMLSLYAYSGAASSASAFVGAAVSSASGNIAAWGLQGSGTGEAKYVFDNGASSGTTISSVISIEGKFESLTKDWLTTSGAATLKHVAGESSFTITANSKSNLKDLNLTFDGNGNAAVPGKLAADVSIGRYQGFADVVNTSGSAVTSSANIFSAKQIATGETSTFVFDVDGESHTITLTAGSSAVTAIGVVAALKGIFAGSTATGFTASGTTVLVDGVAYVKASGSGSSAVAGTDMSAFKLAGFEYTFGSSATGFGLVAKDITDTSIGGTIIVNQIGQTSGATAATFVCRPRLEESTSGQVVIDFGQGLLAGQSYNFNGKSVVATRDLTGAEVAEAFTYGAGESFDGAVIVGTWSAHIQDSKILFGIDGSKLTIQDTFTPTSASASASSFGIKAGTEDFLTGTGALAVNTNKVSGTTTQQGQNQEEILASSYVVFSASDLGSAGSGADSVGTAANIKAVTSALDTITNFDIANDKLLLNKFDANLSGTAGRYGFADLGSVSNIGSIYVDTAGNTLAASAANGIIGFSAGNAAADAITLDMKLYVAVNNLAANKVAGFEHDGDFYVVATGGNASGSTTDDLVIKLAGVTGVTDITTLLA